MHFFEDAEAQIAALPDGWERDVITFVPGAMQHVALRVGTEGEVAALRERLRSAGVPVTGLSIRDHTRAPDDHHVRHL